MRKKVFRPGERVENEDNDSHTTLLTPTSDDDLLLGPGDSYWPRNMSQPGGCPSEVITALQDPCWAISLPSDLQDMARYLLVRLERRRMYDRVLSRRTWKFR